MTHNLNSNRSALRDWRVRCGLTMQEAARALGIARQTYSYYERGQGAIPVYINLACSAIEFKIEPIWEPDAPTAGFLTDAAAGTGRGGV